MTPTAPLPAALAMAAMVSVEFSRGILETASKVYDLGLAASASTTWLMRHCCAIVNSVLVSQ